MRFKTLERDALNRRYVRHEVNEVQPLEINFHLISLSHDDCGCTFMNERPSHKPQRIYARDPILKLYTNSHPKLQASVASHTAV